MAALGELAEAICAVKEKEAKRLVAEYLDAGRSPLEILEQCHLGMGELGDRFGRGDCFIPELIMAGSILDDIMKDLGPRLEETAESKGSGNKVVIGTVLNDVHDLGKDIVITMLKGSGFDVVDLGINVPADRFVEAIRESGATLVGLSILLTTCYQSITDTVEAIKKAGLRDQVSIMVGGAAATNRLAEMTGCDFYGKTAVDAVNFATEKIGA